MSKAEQIPPDAPAVLWIIGQAEVPDLSAESRHGGGIKAPAFRQY
jgi:hypothetical protein